MQTKTERFELRLDRQTVEQIDAWRTDQSDLPSRAEAMRRLVDAGLTVSRGDDVQLSSGEKLILMMLHGLYRHHRVKAEIDPDFVADTIFGGHYWALEWKYPGVFHAYRDNQRVLSEVVDILDMWSFIESAYTRLPQDERAQIEVAAEPFGKNVAFRGFDGNNESEHLGIARFLIGDLDRFDIFKGRDLNSHAPIMGAYKRILEVFLPIRKTLTGGELSSSQIIALLNAQPHPSHRTRS